MGRLFAAVAGSPIVFLLVLGGLAGLLVLFSLEPAIQARRAMEARVAGEREALEAKRAEEAEGLETFRAAREDPVYVEALARKVLGFRGDGETAVPLPEAALAAAAAPPPPTTDPAPRPSDLAGLPIPLARWASLAALALVLLAVNGKALEDTAP